MFFDTIAEAKIREAMAEGEFDNLEGMGRPLRSLDAYFATPEHLRLGYSILKNAGVLPEEIEMRREIASLQDRLKRCTDEAERESCRRLIEDRRLKYQLIMERYHRTRR